MNLERKWRILLVDDQEMIRFTLRVFLENLGHQVWEACHGQEALDLLKKQLPDVIVSDMDMPLMNGEAMCLALSQDPAWAQLPVVLMTGHDFPGLRRARQVLPQARSLSKPFTMDQFMTRLAETIGQR